MTFPTAIFLLDVVTWTLEFNLEIRAVKAVFLNLKLCFYFSRFFSIIALSVFSFSYSVQCSYQCTFVQPLFSEIKEKPQYKVHGKFLNVHLLKGLVARDSLANDMFRLSTWNEALWEETLFIRKQFLWKQSMKTCVFYSNSININYTRLTVKK